MFRLILASIFIIATSSIFLFSKQKPRENCTQSLLATVQEMRDGLAVRLVLKAEDGIFYYPFILDKDIVIAAGSKVRVCHDGIEKQADNKAYIRIKDVVSLP